MHERDWQMVYGGSTYCLYKHYVPPHLPKNIRGYCSEINQRKKKYSVGKGRESISSIGFS